MPYQLCGPGPGGRSRDEAKENLERGRRDLQAAGDKERAKRAREEELQMLLQEAESRLVDARHMETKIRGQYRTISAQFGQWHDDFYSSKTQEEMNLEQFLLQS
jgi:hypothetical protein